MLPVTCGVPQGSVLGPLFFLVYVNDIQEAVGSCGVKLYADDTVLYQSGVNGNDARVKLQESVNKFKKWCDVHALTINASKTKVMAFATRSKVKKCKNIVVRIGADQLKLVPHFKYLGLTLDSTLNFTKHIAPVVQLICHKMTLLAKLKKYLRLDYGDGSKIRLGRAFSLISQALLNIERYVIHQIEAEYLSYQLVLMKV